MQKQLSTQANQAASKGRAARGDCSPWLLPRVLLPWIEQLLLLRGCWLGWRAPLQLLPQVTGSAPRVGREAAGGAGKLGCLKRCSWWAAPRNEPPLRNLLRWRRLHAQPAASRSHLLLVINSTTHLRLWIAASSCQRVGSARIAFCSAAGALQTGSHGHRRHA